MYTAMILMCTAEMWCYPIVYESDFLETRKQCEAEISRLIESDEFDAVYRFHEQGLTYNVYNTVCINWEEKDI